MSGGLLTRPYPHGLGEHVEGDGFISGLEFAITAKAVHVLQGFLLAADCEPIKMNILCAESRGASMQKDSLEFSSSERVGGLRLVENQDGL
jgi:hypothetical protein